MTELRDYQAEAVQSVYDWFQAGKGNPLVVAPTGSGKSVILSEFCRRAIHDFPGTRIVVAQHVKELIQQNATALMRLWSGAPVGIYSAGLGSRQRRQVTFAGIQSVARRAAEFGDVDILIIDECFVAGTLIETTNGPIPIEKIPVGAVVKNALGYGKVDAVSVKYVSEITEVCLSDGTSIQCTGNHPFFTEEGWTEAGKLARGSVLFGSEELRKLWRRVQARGGAEGRQTSEGDLLEKAEVLLNILLQESGKSDVGSRRQREDVGNTEVDGTPAAADGQRQGIDRTARGAGELAGGWMGDGSCSPDWKAQGRSAPKIVQDRHSQSWLDDRSGSGRIVTPRQKSSGGSAEGRAFGGVRVVSVSRQKCASPRIVYNLQVSGHPSYFASGVLVHNCHLIPRNSDTQYQTFIAGLRETNPELKVIGLTATPFRLDSGRLDRGRGAIFDGIAYDIPIPMLVKRGYLAPLISKRPGQVFDVAGLHTRGGDYVESEMVARFDTEAVTRAAVQEVAAAGQDRRSWLLFCISVEHAAHVRDEVRRHGISAEMVTGATPADERARILAAFKDGRIRALTNVNVLTTGFDAPATDLLAFLRPTQSLGLYMQMAGRAMRTAPGKENGLVLDFAGNVVRHGPVDAVSVSDAREKGPRAKREGEAETPAKTCPGCQSIVWIGARECPDCGHEFPPPPVKIEKRASTEAIMNLTAEDDWRAVRDVAFLRHVKDGVASLRAEYLVDMDGVRGVPFRVVKEFVCFDHSGFARRKAVEWWHRHAGTSPPESTDEALKRIGEVRIPEEAVIRKEGEWWRVARVRGDARQGRAA